MEKKRKTKLKAEIQNIGDERSSDLLNDIKQII